LSEERVDMKIGNKIFEDDCFASAVDPDKKGSMFKCNFPRFPDFGKEVRRSYEVSEICYDCMRFADGCKGWKAKREFACERLKLYRRVEAG